MNPNWAKLQPYPFEKLRLLFKDIAPDARYTAITLELPLQAASVAAGGDEAQVAQNRRPMENTACTARSSSNAWMPRPAPRRTLANCSAAIGRQRNKERSSCLR